jgi:uncharacterized membrane protein
MKKTLVALTLALAWSASSFAHEAHTGGESRHPAPAEQAQPASRPDGGEPDLFNEHGGRHPGVQAEEKQMPERPLTAFPTWHPIVVHFPVVLLLVASFLFVAGLLRQSRDWQLIGIAAVWLGFLGAAAAAYLVHPHATGLTNAAKEVLERHEFLAETTVSLSGAASLLGVLCLTGGLRPRVLLNLLLATLLIACAVSVSLTGHAGAQLTHLHGVGPQGHFLEPH